MTLAAAALPPAEPEIELDDTDIHARAWAMVERVFDSVPDRIVLLHAAAMLQAALAMNQTNPTAALGELLGDHCRSAGDIMQTAIAMSREQN